MTPAQFLAADQHARRTLTLIAASVEARAAILKAGEARILALIDAYYVPTIDPATPRHVLAAATSRLKDALIRKAMADGVFEPSNVIDLAQAKAGRAGR